MESDFQLFTAGLPEALPIATAVGGGASDGTRIILIARPEAHDKTPTGVLIT